MMSRAASLGGRRCRRSIISRLHTLSNRRTTSSCNRTRYSRTSTRALPKASSSPHVGCHARARNAPSPLVPPCSSASRNRGARGHENIRRREGIRDDDLSVFTLVWAVAAKLGGETVTSRIHVWTFTGNSGIAWSSEDEKRLLNALVRYGMEKWEDVARCIPGKSAGEVENHFHQTYPLAYTHHAIMNPNDILKGVAADSTQGKVATARWLVRARPKNSTAVGPKLTVPHVWDASALKKYGDEKMYETDSAVIISLIWCIAATVGDETIISPITVCTLA